MAGQLALNGICVLISLVVLLSDIHGVLSNDAGSQELTTREKRVIPLLSVVRFKNEECSPPTGSAAPTGTDGVCYSSTECTSKGGTAAGSCASGFGICCYLSVTACGGTVNDNSTYISNVGYPSTVTSATSGSCTYTINYCSTEICQIRLYFNKMVLAQPTASSGLIDTWVTAGPTSNNPPAIGGTNTGYHMYFEVAPATSSSTITVNIATSDTSTARSWNVKVDQIECYNKAKAPTGCTQYFTSTAGTMDSYNYSNGELPAQEVSYCVRKNAGTTQIQYTEAGTTAFIVGATTAAASTDACAIAAVFIPQTVTSGSASTNNDFVCQGTFTPKDADTTPGVFTQVNTYRLYHRRVAQATTAFASGITGFRINYNSS